MIDTLYSVDPDQKELISVTGGVKSGKSRYAEHLLRKCKNVTYVATHDYDKNDSDWNKRIDQHKSRRPESWSLIEKFNEPDNLFSQLNTNNIILIDSLGGIVVKHLLLDEQKWLETQEQYLRNFVTYPSSIIFVIESVGWGVSPPTKSANIFRDRLGIFADILDKLCSSNWLVLHGRAININEFSNIVP